MSLSRGRLWSSSFCLLIPLSPPAALLYPPSLSVLFLSFSLVALLSGLASTPHQYFRSLFPSPFRFPLRSCFHRPAAPVFTVSAIFLALRLLCLRWPMPWTSSLPPVARRRSARSTSPLLLCCPLIDVPFYLYPSRPFSLSFCRVALPPCACRTVPAFLATVIILSGATSSLLLFRDPVI